MRLMDPSDPYRRMRGPPGGDEEKNGDLILERHGQANFNENALIVRWQLLPSLRKKDPTPQQVAATMRLEIGTMS